MQGEVTLTSEEGTKKKAVVEKLQQTALTGSIPGESYQQMVEYASAIELKASEFDGCGAKCFSLSLREHNLVLCSLGASILSWKHKDVGDIVLGYKSVEAIIQSRNPVYFGAVVGRVANRIALGKLTVDGNTCHLEINDQPNHLHGGGISGGFSHKQWNGEIINFRGGKAVRFSLLSEDGDQGYPGAVRVTAIYSLRPSLSSTGVVLRLDLDATLIGEKSSPINLAQHSYFNLSGQERPEGILDHRLILDSDAYTPVDSTSIPTREVRPLDQDHVMDWRRERSFRDALHAYGVNKVGLSVERAKENLKQRIQSEGPYGFDHNYVVREQPGTSIARVASLKYRDQSLTVYSNAPGVQLYTGNYLSANESASICKAQYGPWSGVCLETQHYPDSILDPSDVKGDFAKGRCCLLTAKKPKYEHTVEYCFEPNRQAILENVGSDTDAQKFESRDDMWAAQDFSSWYALAKDYYEENCSATIDGVLGGIGWISDTDLNGSKDFMSQIKLPKSDKKSVACECGAGIGRVTKGLLLDLCDRCDLVESNSRLLFAAPEYIGESSYKCRFFSFELQNWDPPKNKYTIVWIQWVLCYLTDQDIVSFLRKCGESLVDGGVIILKENTCGDQAFVVDVEDASVCRSLPYWLDLIFTAGLRVTHHTWQRDFPDDIFPVPLLALTPDR